VKRILGPYPRSLSAQCIGLIERGVETAREMAERMGLLPMDINHHLRVHVRSGLLTVEHSPQVYDGKYRAHTRYTLTELGRSLLERKGQT
jgi:predicted ArsR family transcriptional regulator